MQNCRQFSIGTALFMFASHETNVFPSVVFIHDRSPSRYVRYPTNKQIKIDPTADSLVQSARGHDFFLPHIAHILDNRCSFISSIIIFNIYVYLMYSTRILYTQCKPIGTLNEINTLFLFSGFGLQFYLQFISSRLNNDNCRRNKTDPKCISIIVRFHCI